MSVSAPIAVVASLNYDITAHSQRIPLPGETVMGTDMSYSLGGKGGNQAVALSRLGSKTSLIACLGDDPSGIEYRRALTQEDLDLTHLKTSVGGTTGTALITVDQRGTNTIVVIPGANEEVTADLINEAQTTIESSSAVLAQLETPLSGVRRAFSIGKHAGSFTVLNSAPALPFADLEDLFQLTDVLIPNEIEFAQILGKETLNNETIHDDCQCFFEAGIQCVVVTTGADGCIVVWPDEVEIFPAYSADVVDTTAAGDSFVAGFVHAIAADGEITKDSVRLGVHTGSTVAAYVVARNGAQNSLPNRDDL